MLKKNLSNSNLGLKQRRMTEMSYSIIFQVANNYILNEKQICLQDSNVRKLSNPQQLNSLMSPSVRQLLLYAIDS